MAEKKASSKVAEKGAAPAPKPVKAKASKVEATAGSTPAVKRAAKPKVPQKTTNPYSKAAPRGTFVADASKVERHWFVVDATDLVLGRAASRIASILRGKHKPIYTPHVDTGDFVIIVNAEKVKLTGSKDLQKPYYRHSMHPGGLKTILARDVRVRDPERLLQDAIRRMISRNPLGRDMMSKLHVYKGPSHPHQAQKPKPLALA